jgi:uncharacterized protein (DUF885 family)
MMEMPESLPALAKEYWDALLMDDPPTATLLGDRRFDDLLRDVTPEGRARWREQLDLFLRRARSIDGRGLGEADRLTLGVLVSDMQARLEFAAAGTEEWEVNPLQGIHIEFINVESYQPSGTPSEGRAMVKRWSAMGGAIDAHVANLRRSARAGKVATRSCVEKVAEELKEVLSKPDAEWTLLRPLSAPHESWSSGEVGEFRKGLAEAVANSVRPAFQRYHDFLRSEITPMARPQERPGIMHTPGGREAYARLVAFHTSTSLTPEEIHELGLGEVARINGEMEALGEKVFGMRDRTEILKRLRSDRSLYFDSREQVEEKARSSLKKAKAAIPAWFGKLPKADCEVVAMGDHEAKHSTIAYYRQPAEDGTRPGRYYINTWAPETRPRYEAEALAYHESIPGHHLQIAISQELEGIPEFRKNNWVTAFIEGWGLYTERLADQMGLYSSDLDRVGVLSFDSWRACRLVVDTGMHAKGWSRSQAIDFMLRNTALAENNIVNEVDRYIAWPGQALAYKTGQLEILRLRRRAEKRLGKKFSVAAFHDAVLGSGPVPLEVLAGLVERMAPA